LRGEEAADAEEDVVVSTHRWMWKGVDDDDDDDDDPDVF